MNTPDALITEFLRYIATERRLSDNTAEAYSRDLAQWQEFATDGGRHPLEPATTAAGDLRLWVASLARDGISQRSIRRKVQSLRAFFTFMMRRHGLKANPASQLVLAKLPKTLPVFVRTEEINGLIDRGPDNPDDERSVRDYLIVTMFYETGIRCSELSGLLDRNINVAGGELKVHGKRNKDRIVPFGAELARLIEHYRSLRDAGSDGPTETFFVGRARRPMSREAVYKAVRGSLDAAGVHAARRSPHTLRHTFATDMLNNGADLNAVQQLLGHESLATTQIYTHVTYRELINNYQTAHPRASTSKKGG